MRASRCRVREAVFDDRYNRKCIPAFRTEAIQRLHSLTCAVRAVDLFNRCVERKTTTSADTRYNKTFNAFDFVGSDAEIRCRHIPYRFASHIDRHIEDTTAETSYVVRFVFGRQTAVFDHILRRIRAANKELTSRHKFALIVSTQENSPFFDRIGIDTFVRVAVVKVCARFDDVFEICASCRRCVHNNPVLLNFAACDIVEVPCKLCRNGHSVDRARYLTAQDFSPLCDKVGGHHILLYFGDINHKVNNVEQVDIVRFGLVEERRVVVEETAVRVRADSTSRAVARKNTQNGYLRDRSVFAVFFRYRFAVSRKEVLKNVILNDCRIQSFKSCAVYKRFIVVTKFCCHNKNLLLICVICQNRLLCVFPPTRHCPWSGLPYPLRRILCLPAFQPFSQRFLRVLQFVLRMP